VQFVLTPVLSLTYIQGFTANNDIGVIAPYHAQCVRIRRLLTEGEGVKVGSVEEFQGQVNMSDMTRILAR
jgi:hypothetical protein